VYDFHFIGPEDKLATVPKASSRFSSEIINGGCDGKNQPASDVSNRFEGIHVSEMIFYRI
jgi:hypothetical protein